MQVRRANAERIKRFYVGCMRQAMDDREMNRYRGIPGTKKHDRRTVSRAELIGIMPPRVSEENSSKEVRARPGCRGIYHLRQTAEIVLTGG